MYNPYENNNQPDNNGQNYGPVNQPETPSSNNDNKVDGEYSMKGNQITSDEKFNGAQSNYSGQTVNSYGSTQPNYSNAPTEQPPYSYNNYNQGNASYTWNQQSQRPVKPPKKNKKKGNVPFGVKVLAVFLCCLVSSAASVGVFAALLSNGTIAMKNDGNGNQGFTITKIVEDKDEDVSADVTGALSRQEIAEKVIPSVVCIQNYQIDERFQAFGTATGSEDSEVSPAGEGSGIIISEDGYIVTNAHVVAGASSLKVILSDGTTHEAALVGMDEVTDLAVIKIEAKGLAVAEFGSADDLAVADEVVAIGNPGGYEFNSSVTVGYVSALNRAITNSETGYTMYCIQTDAAINPGNSGGALVNEYGQVVGINSSKIVAQGYEGLGFAIPSETVQPIVSDLIKYGYVKDRAVLGISGQYLDKMTASFYGFPTGMYVYSVNSQQAFDSGLEKGDIITAIDGKEITSFSSLTGAVAQKKPGEKVELTVARPLAGKTDLKITVVLSEYERPEIEGRN